MEDRGDEHPQIEHRVRRRHTRQVRGEDMSDILDGIALIRHKFMEIGLEPPTAILLKSHDEGMRVLSEVMQKLRWTVEAGSPRLGQPIQMADGSAWMEVKVMDIAIRWPANRIAMPDGSWSYE